MASILEPWGRVQTTNTTTTHTLTPIVTGTSVIGIIYKDGILIAADCLASYGSLARFKSQQRIHQIGTTVVASSGDISDHQYTVKMLEELHVDEWCSGDNHDLLASHYYNFLCSVMYKRRCQFNPLWNSHVIAGFVNGQKFLGHVGMLGTRYTSPTIATGFGAHLVQPLLRDAFEKNPALEFGEAKVLLEMCMRTLYYRDGRSANQIQLANITELAIEISDPYVLDTDWSMA